MAWTNLWNIWVRKLGPDKPMSLNLDQLWWYSNLSQVGPISNPNPYPVHHFDGPWITHVFSPCASQAYDLKRCALVYYLDIPLFPPLPSLVLSRVFSANFLKFFFSKRMGFWNEVELKSLKPFSRLLQWHYSFFICVILRFLVLEFELVVLIFWD